MDGRPYYLLARHAVFSGREDGRDWGAGQAQRAANGRVVCVRAEWGAGLGVHVFQKLRLSVYSVDTE